jgi:NADH-quinone oxidoreductase subunit G
MEGVLQRIADVPIYFADPLVRRAPSLQKTRDGRSPMARVHPDTLGKLGVQAGAKVTVRQGEGRAVVGIAADPGVPPGCIRLAAAHPSTAGLGAMFGEIAVEGA